MKHITAVSPQGARVEVRGVRLEVARKVQDRHHFTIHELTLGDAIVAIVPGDWVLLFDMVRE